MSAPIVDGEHADGCRDLACIGCTEVGPVADLCVCCDEPLSERGVTHCDACAELRGDGETPDMLTSLGHAIARFVRRAEVAGLVETLDRAVDVMADPASDYAYDDARDKFAIARDRLARLAGGGA